MSFIAILNKGLTYEFDHKKDSNILESIERQGISSSYSCRSGHCGRCLTKLVKGAVSYNLDPIFVPPEQYILACCTKPEEIIFIEVD